MDTSHGIFEYNLDNFFSYISYQTDTPLHEIKHKTQITYLDNYFNKFKDQKIFFIYENEYIDKNYLEDYSFYYVKCFKTYKRTCSRIHFFQTSDNSANYKSEFKKLLSGESSIINSKNYLGFIVIRPIPHSFLANVCLKPYYENKNRLGSYILSKEYVVSLFGVKLTIQSIAFQEQDKVLSAFATTSLWTFFHAHPAMNLLKIPPSSIITASAYPEKNGYSREFSNKGLSTEMICKNLTKYDFSPEYFEFSNTDLKFSIKDFNFLKEYIFSYCSSGMPLILGVSINGLDSSTEKALHAVTILGYSLNKVTSTKHSLLSHNLEKIYVHDDRFGPFLKIIFNDQQCEVIIKKNKNVSNHNDFTKEIYVPDSLIIGVYQKIRIPYSLIRNTCLDFIESFKEYLVSHYSNTVYAFMSLIWDIQLKENHDFKNNILNSKMKNKEYYLTKSFPKYIWSVTALFSNVPIFEMIFDATDIDKGDVFLEIIPINEDYANSIIKIIKDYSNDNIIFSSFEGANDNLILGILKYFRRKNVYTDTLSELFGYLKIPLRIKQTELYNDMIINQCEKRLYKEDPLYVLDKELSKNCMYIWVIDKEGFLCIGREYKNTAKGHPTLTDGMPARIGGQMTFDPTNNTWEIDPFSGRYSSEYSEDEKKYFLDNAIKYKFNIYFPTEIFIAKKFN